MKLSSSLIYLLVHRVLPLELWFPRKQEAGVSFSPPSTQRLACSKHSINPYEADECARLLRPNLYGRRQRSGNRVILLLESAPKISLLCEGFSELEPTCLIQRTRKESAQKTHPPGAFLPPTSFPNTAVQRPHSLFTSTDTHPGPPTGTHCAGGLSIHYSVCL